MGYNTLIQRDGSRLNFESDFDEVDSDYARIGDELQKSRTLRDLDFSSHSRLAEIVVFQLLRTPLVRKTLLYIPRAITAELADKGLSTPQPDDLLDENGVRQIARDLLAQSASLRDTLLSKDAILFEPVGSGRFWISDHPVVLFSQLPMGEVGLSSLGVEVYLPISADLVLGYLCKSLRNSPSLNITGTSTGVGPVESARLTGIPLKISDSVVNFFNSLQVLFAARFLYASQDDFDLARKMIKLDPSLARNESLLQMGQLGHAPPRPKNIPPGEWLYLENKAGYLLIPISDFQSDGPRRDMTTTRPELVERAIELGSFERAEVFANSGGCSIRGAKVVLMDSSPLRFRLESAGPKFSALDRATKPE